MFDFEKIKNNIILSDCMDIIQHIPDKYFQLAIIDPPYGIGASSQNMGCGASSKLKKKTWDDKTPDRKYFDELFRISQNQIICGGNYFDLPPTRGFIIWDKGACMYGRSFAECEYIWTSFDFSARIFKHNSTINTEARIHKTQKPVALYRWLLQNYAKPEDRIIDTHSGSGSLACACHLEKFDFLAIEKDEHYHTTSVERLETLKSQGVLF